MFVKNLDNIDKKLYYCYSPPLSKWLQDIKEVFPISSGTYIKPNKFYGNKFDVYILTYKVKKYLKEWTNNKNEKDALEIVEVGVDN